MGGKYRHQKYTWQRRGDYVVHWWELIGPKGGLHFRAQIRDPEDPTGNFNDPSCGLEFHFKQPPESMRGQAPSHVDCHLTGGWCWHDGTSLYARETLWPELSQYLQAGNHDAVFRTLEFEADKAFARPTPHGMEEGE